jgi:heat shock protein HslJ
MAADEGSTPEGPLAGTTWRLIEFQSMDDATGALRPRERGDYTLTLSADGTASLQLDCNRASGDWTAEPAPGDSSGTFQFGPLATTMALCPPPSIGEQIGAQLQWVRSFLIRDGRLSLSLMADGGILLWEPADIEEPFSTTPDPALEDAIRAAAPDYTAQMVDPELPGQQARYVYGHTDLNADGVPETFVYMLGSIFCGTGGCDLMLFTEDEGGDYRHIQTFPISRPPVIVSPDQRNGWSDLVRVESGGGAAPTYLRHHFDGERYVEGERTPVGPDSESPAGQLLLAGELTYDVGAPLEPGG